MENARIVLQYLLHQNTYVLIQKTVQGTQLGHAYFRITDKQGILRERDTHIANLEAEINEVLSKLNILQNEKGKLTETCQFHN